ncbi:hypothetical protein D9757_003141 [Collybiopsis confluens]|uniref:F-box domain-containing protein n=1 Tax=Collybiopsis confluens TaxID=2823264 RepID=A0A8H5MEP1_9AGAR|nr:hypothetical protein D9757_003141 [Collybiopsis confluens]
MTQLSDLPPELIATILSVLPSVKDLAACSSVSRTFHTIISTSVLHQYNIELYKACAKDNNNCSLSSSEKLDQLRSREKSWSECTPLFHQKIPVNFNPGSVYDLSGDVYLLGDHTRQLLHFLRLSNTPEHVPQWAVFPSGDTRPIVDFGLNLLEHDIIAVVTATEIYIGALQALSIELSFRQFSTGNFHPLAKVPSIPIAISQEAPSINLEIVGSYLALVTTFWRPPGERSRVYVYEWQTGELVMDISGDPYSYSGVIFLSHDIIMLPNIESSALELWKIPRSGEDQPSSPLLKLSLPRLQPQNILRFMSCRAEPNPVGFNNELKHSSQPFHYDPLESIILLHLRVQNIPNSSLFTIFIHRRSLLELLSNQAINNGKPVPWADWAPPITFCVDLIGLPSRWVTTTSNTRYTRLPGAMEAGDGYGESHIVVIDFNPHNVRKAERELEKDPNVRKAVSRGRRVVDPQRLFAEEITSNLPCVITTTPERYRLDGVLMDESNILGLRTDARGRIRSVEVLHFG